MVRRLFAGTLAAALVVLSPGLDASRAFAAVIAPKTGAPSLNLGGAASVSVPRLPALGAVSLTAPSLSPSLAAPSLTLPAAALAPAPVAPSAAPRAAAPAASLPQMSAALAAPLAAANDGNTGAAAGRASAQQIEDVITGARSIEGSGEASVAGGFAASPVSHAASFLPAPADAPKPAAAPAPEAPKAPAVKVVRSRLGYRLHRLALSAIASLTGAVHSMPAGGPSVTAAAIKAAADKRVVISDFDDTLAAYNQTLSPEMIDAIRSVKAAGKHFVVISDRGDEKRAHQLTVFESLETMPVELRAGMYVAANSGGRVYRYDEQGVPQRVFEIPALENEKKALVSEAAEATKLRMKELGAEQHDPVKSGNNNPAESWNTYGYAMMLKVGSSEKQVRGAAEIMQEELAKRGIEAEVNPRFAKDPANPPYINFSIVTKQPATAYIAKALGATAKDVVLVGDSQYVPKESKKQGSFLDRMGAKLAGRAMPKTGNATDRNMEKALPGALVIAVGHNADPRMSNAWVTDVKGPAATRAMLLSVASKRADAPQRDALGAALTVVGVVGLLAAVGAAGYFMVTALAEILVQGEQLLRQQYMDPFDGAFLLGAGGLLFGALKTGKPGDKKDEDPAKKVNEDEPLSRFERVATGVLLAAAVAGSLFLWYLLYSSFGQLTPAPVEVPPGWQGPIPHINGIEDLFGAAGIGFAGVLGAAGAAKASLRSGLSKVKEFLRPAFPFLAWLGLAALTVGIYAGLFWAASNAPVATPSVPVAPAGWERLFQGGIGFLGLGGAVLGMGMMTRPAVLDNPGDAYASALEKATKVAAQRGVPAEKVLFLQATAVMPLHQGKQWHYQFALPRENGKHDLVYVDFERNLTTVGLDHRVSVYENVGVLPEGAVARPLTSYLLAQRGTLHGPQQALDALRAAHPGFGTSVSVALRLEQTEDLDPWYRFYDNNGAQAAVNARTAAIRVAVAPKAQPAKKGLSGTAKFLIVAALAALAYALVTGQLGAAAGFALAAGAIKKTGGAKVTDDEVRSTASYVIGYKGRPWSSTEFNSVYYPALENLKARGATKKQVALFEKLVADAPVKGGSFNPWSGD